MSVTPEVLRERTAGDDPIPPSALVQEAPDETAPASGLLGLSQSLYGAQREAQASRDRAAGILESKAATMAPQIEGVLAGQQSIADEAMRRQATLETTRPKVTPPPSLGLSPFLAPREGEAPESLVSKFINAIGLFATGIGGLAAGDARGSLAAMTGALTGWDAGDRLRADRALADWQTKTDAALKAWELERTSYADWFKAANVSVEQMMAGLQLEALKHDNAAAVEVFRGANLDKAVAFFQERDRAARELTEIYGKLSTAQADAALRGLPEKIRAELSANPDVVARINAGLRPTPEQVREAIANVETRDLNHKVEVSRQQGMYAAQIPQRTPESFLKVVGDVTMARSQLDEMRRLSQRIDLNATIGGIRPWVNQIISTGKAGPFPISPTVMGTLSPDQQRFLSLTQDYASTIIQLRSGAAVTPQEFERLLTFLTDQGVTGDTFVARLGLQEDQMRAKAEAIGTLLSSGGYRVPQVPVPSLAPSGAPPSDERVRVIGPKGERGTVPAGSALPQGWRRE